RRSAGAELEPAVAHAVEHGRHLRGAYRVVVRKGQQPDAVADADRLRPRRDRAVEDLGRRAMRELGEEVVLDRPEVREADLLAEHGLVDDAMVGVPLAPLVPRRGDRDLVEEAEVELGHRFLRPKRAFVYIRAVRVTRTAPWGDSPARSRSSPAPPPGSARRPPAASSRRARES